MPRYTKDIAREPVYRFFDRSLLLWQIALAGLLSLAGLLYGRPGRPAQRRR